MPIVRQEGVFDPTQAIVPLFSLNGSGLPSAFLGTGFFVGEESALVTANHVIKDKGPIGIIVLPDLKNVHKATILKADQEADLVILQVNDYKPIIRFSLFPDDDILFNQLCTCCEYGTTIAMGTEIQISPAVRTGNVTRRFKSLDVYGKAGEDALELSFPALRGASGAPVLTSDNFLVVGIVIANLAHYLHPVQIEKITDEKGKAIEETRFMLPQAIAVHVKHLRNLMGQ